MKQGGEDNFHGAYLMIIGSVWVGFLYTDTEIFLLLCLRKVSVSIEFPFI